MKFVSTLLIVLLFAGFSMAQEIRFEVRGSASHPIKKDQLQKALTLNDIRPNYPSSWITNYTIVEIKSISNGITVQAEGMNDTLTEAQKQLLGSVEIGADIVFDISHMYRNPVTGMSEPRKINFTYTLIPEIEATYVGGTEQLNTYLEEKAISKISDEVAGKLTGAVVSFVVNEKGDIKNVKITSSSGNAKTDKLLLSAIAKMPKWESAENNEGIKVKQSFLFTVGYPGC
jgi:TonB family protein